MPLKLPPLCRPKKIGRFLLPVIVNWLSLLLLLTLLLSQTGCGTNLQQSAPVSPSLPAPPSVTTQTPSVAYSESAKARIQKWRALLTEHPLMSEPSSKPGQP